MGYQNCNTSQIFIFGGHLKVRESLYTRVIIWVNTTLNHFDTRAILPEVESSCMVERPKWNLKQTYHQTPNTLVVSKYVKFLIYRLPNGIKRR